MRSCLLSLLVPVVLGVLARDRPASAAVPAEEEPWQITGESLEGSRLGESRLTSPRAEQGGTVITARDGVWRRQEGLLILSGDVVIEDSCRTLTADTATFNYSRALGILTGHVRGMGPEGQLSARELWFWRDEDRLELRDSASADDGTRLLRACRIEYDTRAQKALAVGGVVILDREDSTRVLGDRCAWDRLSDLAIVTGSPFLHQPGREGGQSFELWADTLAMRQTEQLGEARGHVRLRRGSVNAEAGRAHFDSESGILRLEQMPVARDPDGEVLGDSMAVVMRGGRVERLEVLGNTVLRHRPQAKPGERNLVTGDTLIAWVDSLGIREIEVLGSARSLYFPAPEDRQRQVGSNLSRGRVIRVILADGEAKRVDLSGAANGEYLLPRERSDTTVTRLSDSVYVARATAHFLAHRDLPIPDSLESAGPFDPAERVSYRGEQIVFFIPDRRIEIEGAGKVVYQNMELESERIVYEASFDRVTALGEPTLRDQSSELVGERMVYRLDRKQGFVYQGKTKFEGGFYRGEEIKRVDKRILLVRGGDYTTCDADTSHFHFHSNRMKIVLHDRVIARPIVLYLKNIPLLAFPYWVFPIRSGRHSGVLMPDVEFGFDRRRGRFLRNIGYYWATSDYADAMLWGDYYEKNPRWVVNGQVRYSVRYLLGGEIFTSYSGEESYGGRQKRWDLRGSHDQTLGERFTLRVRADFVSDKNYRDDREFGGSVDERLNRILKSDIDLRKSWSKTSIAMTTSRTEYLERESAPSDSTRIQQNLPSIDFSLGTFPIGTQPDETGRGGRLSILTTTYVSLSSSFRSTFSKKWGESTVDNQAASVRTGLSDSRKIGRYLTFRPSVSSTGAWFRRDARDRGHQVGAVWSTGASASSTVYGTFPLALGPLVALRHVVEPSVSYNYAPRFARLQYEEYDQESGSYAKRNRFPSVGGIGLSGSEVSSMSMVLTQRFHAKLRGEDPTKPRKIDNLILWTTSTAFDFLKQTKGEKPLSSITNSIRLNASRFLDNSWSITHHPYRKVMTSLSVQTGLRFSGTGGRARADSLGQSGIEEYGGFGQADASTGRAGQAGVAVAGPWTLQISHSYSRGEDRSRESSTLNLAASISPTTGWRVNYSIYYDLRNREIRSQSFTLRRDLHCWEMKLDRRISGGNSQYYFRINVKSLPDVQYERQQR